LRSTLPATGDDQARENLFHLLAPFVYSLIRRNADDSAECR
jgi:hypothetical protein